MHRGCRTGRSPLSCPHHTTVGGTESTFHSQGFCITQTRMTLGSAPGAQPCSTAPHAHPGPPFWTEQGVVWGASCFWASALGVSLGVG